MKTLFDAAGMQSEAKSLSPPKLLANTEHRPLADRLRPPTLADVVGQVMWLVSRFEGIVAPPVMSRVVAFL